MHDTPNHALFDRTTRAFSHGCIRLSEPDLLAEFVLAQEDTSWDSGKMSKVVSSEIRTVKSLKNPMAVHINL